MTHRLPGGRVERYHTAQQFTVRHDGETHEVVLAETVRPAYDRENRKRVVVFGRKRGRNQIWTQFVETDKDSYAAKLYDPSDPKKTLFDARNLPAGIEASEVQPNDKLFTSVADGPALRFVVDRGDTRAMIWYGLWSASLSAARKRPGPSTGNGSGS
jgi:hypothetical protein